ncbi:hypothetical protein Tco_1274984 [Tanacetum coccineum]
MFDEYLEPPSVERLVPPAPAVQISVVLAGTPSSTTIDQDAPSTSHSPSSSVVQPPISYQGVAAGLTIEDNPFAQANNDPFVNVFAPEPSSDESSSEDVSSAESTQVIQPHNHLGKWSKDHPLDNVIGNPSRLSNLRILRLLWIKLAGLKLCKKKFTRLGDKDRRHALLISKMKAAYYQDFGLEELVPSLHSAYSDRHAVRSHMNILSVVSLKTYSRYGYTYLKEIVLQRADYNEYKISESDFKNLHPNDFEDMYLFHLQGKLNHLSGSKKVNLFNVVNLWIRNIIIRKRVEDLLLGIESYQTKLNLTELSWDATDFLFKEDYTIVSKSRAVIYRDRNNQKKIMRETEVYKFSDGTLTRILEKLDHMVKDFRLFKYNPSIENRIWYEDDKRRSKEFMEVIERRLKIRRIFRSLESFVSGRRITTITNNTLLQLIKEEYDIWAMEMEHYLEYIVNEVWKKVNQNGNSKKRISIGKDGIVRILSPVTAIEIQAVEKERKAKNILLMAIPKEHMRRFKEWHEAKRSGKPSELGFGSKCKFTEKAEGCFQTTLEAHGAEISTEDANHKFLRSLPPAWSNLAMTMRTKPEVDTLSIDDLYNNLRVFEQEIQGASKTSSSAQNVAFVSQSKSSTNKVKSGFTGAYSTCTPSTSSTNIPEKEVLVGFANEVIYSLFAKQSEDWDLLHKDLEQINDSALKNDIKLAD